MPNIIGNVLIDENNSNIFACRKAQKGFFDLREFGVSLDNQKVGLVCCAMTNARQNETCDSVLYTKGKKNTCDRNARHLALLTLLIIILSSI